MVSSSREALLQITPNNCNVLAGLCPDWETWDPKKPVDNAREAMQQADDWLGVPQVRLRAWDQLEFGLRRAGEVAWALLEVTVYSCGIA